MLEVKEEGDGLKGQGEGQAAPDGPIPANGHDLVSAGGQSNLPALVESAPPEAVTPPSEADRPAGLEIPPELQRRGVGGFITGRISVKIVGPYLLLMFIMAVLGTFVVMRLVSGSLQQRFTNQLLDAGKSVNDTVIKVEQEQLELLRLMAATEGVDTGIVKNDPVALQRLLVPLEVNSKYNMVDVVNISGQEVLALRPSSGDLARALDPGIGQWDVTQKTLSGQADEFGDKYSDLVYTSFGPVMYTGAPVRDSNNKVVGAVLVGISFDDLLKRLTKDVLANITVYKPDGTVLGTTLPIQASNPVLKLDPATYKRATTQADNVVERSIRTGSDEYLELVGNLLVRHRVVAGLGVAVPTNFIAQQGARTRTQMVILFSVVVCGVLIVGLTLARRITAPILVLVRACQLVASGDLEQQVNVRSKDETGVLAHTFNQMVGGLKERDFIRDTFGRYMTQQVSDAILSGDLKLGGERKKVTMLMSDIRGFTTLSESMEPEDLVAFLNRYFRNMIDCVVKYEGVVDKFMGDAILVVYGAPIPHEDDARRAVLTALAMRERLVEFNRELVESGHTTIRIGIGINTGDVIAGNIGSEVRMEYTVIGDTVNATQRTEDLTKEFKTDILISDTTYAEVSHYFEFDEPHTVTLRGRSQQTSIYPVLGLRSGMEELLADSGPVLAEQVAQAQEIIDSQLSALSGPA